ncbi:DUF397 domain-containing protein [Actinomadura graeca]|uniref:DUF397 domain-containing protein n=1 Tax=Actinomadura graeca TaxID=2750812 RepID=A0ABX8QXJ5_9ACTN|nr:DUF397 domain-containing protein [Actinomadura graeca]QXJ22689.1 DUF397 domain-containing protein [Actinomadura graeca]
MTRWRKSSRSNTQGNECVEAASLSGGVGLRDSKAPDGGHLTLTPAAFARLLTALKHLP